MRESLLHKLPSARGTPDFVTPGFNPGTFGNEDAESTVGTIHIPKSDAARNNMANFTQDVILKVRPCI